MSLSFSLGEGVGINCDPLHPLLIKKRVFNDFCASPQIRDLRRGVCLRGGVKNAVLHPTGLSGVFRERWLKAAVFSHVCMNSALFTQRGINIQHLDEQGKSELGPP